MFGLLDNYANRYPIVFMLGWSICTWFAGLSSIKIFAS